MNFIDELNPAQKEAVLYNEGPHLVVAGAGSGKTRVLTYKVAYLLSQGVEPYRILALTFTNKAAREMKERIGKLVGQNVARYVWMGTFHSICAQILRAEHKVIGYPKDFTIYDTPDSKSVLRQIVKDFGEDEKIYKTGDLLGVISEAKNGMIDEVEYAKTKEFAERDRRQRHYRMAEIYREYQRRLRNSYAMDFDDLLFNVNRLFTDHPEVLAKYQNNILHILVDEYQDTNFSQYLIVRSLAEQHKHICVVGDDAQSIYGFRGADIRNILMFQQNYPGSPIFKLERNYRSTQSITNAANSLIHHNRNQIRKDVYSENAVGEPVSISTYSTDRDEAHAIVGQLKKLRTSAPKSIGAKTYDWNEMAVLYRTNAQSRVIEDELRKNAIPYSIYGGLSFYQRKEIKDALAFFRIAVNSSDNEAFTRVVSVAKGVGETTMKHIRQAANDAGVCYYEVCLNPARYNLPCSAATIKKISSLTTQLESFRQMADTMDAYEFACDVMNRSGLMATAAADTSAEGVDRLENLKELQSAIHEFVEINTARLPETHDPAEETVVRVHDFLSEVALLTDQDERQKDDSKRVSLMTVHAAKGLEFNVVCIAGLEENLFPSGFVQSERELEEERRLFYVALTRAKELCYVTAAKSRFKNGQFSFQTPSRFIKELDPRFVKQASLSTPRPFNAFDAVKAFDAINAFDRMEQPARPTSPTSRPGMTSMSSMTSLSSLPRDTRNTSAPSNPGAYKEGDRVSHGVFGPGKVLAYYVENGNEKLDVLFDRSGKKTLLLKFAKLERI